MTEIFRAQNGAWNLTNAESQIMTEKTATCRRDLKRSTAIIVASLKKKEIVELDY